MRELAKVDARAAAPPFQFSLRALLVLMTLFSVAAALFAWWPALGGVVLLLVLSACLTVLAIVGQFPRLTYYAAAFSCGGLWHLALCIPISLLGFIFVGSFPSPEITFYLCTASLLAATAMRWWIANIESDFPFLCSVVLSLVMGVIFTLVASIAGWLGIPGSSPLVTTLADSIYAMVYVISSIYVLGPTAFFTIMILRDAERLATDRFSIQYDVLTAVRDLEGQNRDPQIITAQAIASEAGYHLDLTEAYLERLLKRGDLEYDEPHGYRWKPGK